VLRDLIPSGHQYTATISLRRRYGIDQERHRCKGERPWFYEKKSIETVESLLEIVKGTLEDGDDVLVSGFGKFCVKEKKKRRGRNPATGSDLTLRERKVVTFKCSGKLRSKINGS
jgi:integration host factor subunit alpha